VLRYRLIHPPLLTALAETGHGSQILLADSNYAHTTNVRPGVNVIHLNLRAGLVRVDEILDLIMDAVPLEAACGMRPDGGGEPEVFPLYRQALGEDLPLTLLDRQDFYAAAKSDDLAFVVATGDERLYANLLLTVGFIRP
jgi:L-fucose mutarotase